MCQAVNITDKNALVYNKWSDHGERYDVGLSRLKLRINADAYNQVLKLTAGKLPEKVRTYKVQFETENYSETISNTNGFYDDEIVFAYIPIPLKPDPNDQNLIRFFSLRPSDVTDKGINIPASDGMLDIEQEHWQEILYLFD